MSRRRLVGISILILLFVLCVILRNTNLQSKDIGKSVEEKFKISDKEISLYISRPEKILNELEYKRTFENLI